MSACVRVCERPCTKYEDEFFCNEFERERERETRIYIASNLPAYANKQRGERPLILAVYVSALARVCV